MNILLALREFYAVYFDNIHPFSPTLPKATFVSWPTQLSDLCFLILQDNMFCPNLPIFVSSAGECQHQQRDCILRENFPLLTQQLTFPTATLFGMGLHAKLLIGRNCKNWEEGGSLSLLLLLCHVQKMSVS